MKTKYNPSIVDIISYCCILLFVYAASSKLIEFARFKVQIGQSPLIAEFAAQVSILVPALEIVIVVLLTFAKTRLLGLYCFFTMMVMFTAYIIVILGFSEHIPCSCGGILQKLGWKEHLLFNIGFVLLTLIAILMESKTDDRRINESEKNIHCAT